MWYICFGNTCGCCNTTNCCYNRCTQNASTNCVAQTNNGCGCYNRCLQTATTANNGGCCGAANTQTNGNGGYYYGTFQVRNSGGCGGGCKRCGYAGLNGDAYYARQYGFTTVDAIDY